MNPATAHAPISNAGESTSRPISADTIKMPEPIIEPMTSMVALVRPNPCDQFLILMTVKIPVAARRRLRC